MMKNLKTVGIIFFAMLSIAGVWVPLKVIFSGISEPNDVYVSAAVVGIVGGLGLVIMAAIEDLKK